MIGESKKAKELVNAFLSRNEDAIRQTSVLFGAYLFRIALNITGNQEDAEECVQDAYLSAWNSIPPEEPENLKAWLSMVVRRKAIDRYREQQAKKRVSSEYALSVEEYEGILSGTFDLEKELERKAIAETVNAYLKAAPARRRAVFIGRYYYAYPVDRLAKELHVSRSTIQKELAVIRKELRLRLERGGIMP